MTRPGLLEGALAALAASIIGSGALLLLSPLTGQRAALHIVIAACALAYLVYLLWRGRPRAGRVTVPAAWALLGAAVLLADASLAAHLLAQAALVWAVRAWCFHGGVLPALADLGVVAAGLSALVWALHHGAGLALAIWSLMLVQSLFVLLPAPAYAGVARRENTADDEAFERAHRTACSALHRVQGGA